MKVLKCIVCSKKLERSERPQGKNPPVCTPCLQANQTYLVKR